MQQGFYTDPPSRRLAYDSDGTLVFNLSTGNILTQIAANVVEDLNDESDTVAINVGTNIHYGYLVFIFPELRDLTHIYKNSPIGNAFHFLIPSVIEWSNNTTNGLDGNWTSTGVMTTVREATVPNYRESIQALSMPSIKGLRISYPNGGPVSVTQIGRVHLYGYKSAGETPHRIDFVASDNSELTQDFDYGDQPRDTDRVWSPVETFNLGTALYLRNRSPDKIAQGVQMSVEALTGTMPSDTTLSKDNVSYANILTWTEIQPLATVGPIYVQHTTDADETLGLRTERLRVSVTTWV